MNLWRLELARLLRTHRWMILAGVFGLFAVTGPLLVAYLEEFVDLVGGGVVMQLPEAGPDEAILGYLDGVSDLGLLAVVVVASAALAMDARPEVTAFLRTRVTGVRALVLPRYAVTAVAAAVTLVAGMAVAWGVTAAVLGGPAPVPVLLGTGCAVLYLGFAVAVVAAVASWARGVVGTLFASVLALLALPLVALVEPVRPWRPSAVLGATGPLLAGAPATDLLPAVAVTLLATPALLALAVRRFARREL